MALAAMVTVAQSHREVTLSEGWQFSRDSINWQDVTVPHDWAIGGRWCCEYGKKGKH